MKLIKTLLILSFFISTSSVQAEYFFNFYLHEISFSEFPVIKLKGAVFIEDETLELLPENMIFLENGREIKQISIINQVQKNSYIFFEIVYSSIEEQKIDRSLKIKYNINGFHNLEGDGYLFKKNRTKVDEEFLNTKEYYMDYKNTYLKLIDVTKKYYLKSATSDDYSEIFKIIIDQYIRLNYMTDKNNSRSGDCIYGQKEGFALSCITSHWEKDWITDFDKDGQNDILIRLTDEGLGGGGNAFYFCFKIVTLTQNYEIKDVYTIDGGGQGTLALLSVDTLKNGKIYTTLEQNPRGYLFAEVTHENKQSTPLVFYLENNRIIEQSYSNCQMAEMNKTIFKEVLDCNYSYINRESVLDISYNEKQTENLVIDSNSSYSADLSGCENFHLNFSHLTTYIYLLRNDKKSIKKNWLTFFEFLINNTRYKTLLTNLRLELNTLDYSKIEINELGRPFVSLELKSGWKAEIFTSEVDFLNKKKSVVYLTISKIENNEALPYWDAILRKKELKHSK